MNFNTPNKTSLKQVIPSEDDIEGFLSIDNIRTLPSQGYNINEIIYGKTLLMSAVCMVSQLQYTYISFIFYLISWIK